MIHARIETADRIVGHWSCNLLTEALVWDDGVYDLFGLPRGMPIDRATSVRLYDRQSRIAMECLRTQAIIEKGSFTIDVGIVTPFGQHRRMRIAATVEAVDGKAVRLYGTKRDVSDEA